MPGIKAKRVLKATVFPIDEDPHDRAGEVEVFSVPAYGSNADGVALPCRPVPLQAQPTRRHGPRWGLFYKLSGNHSGGMAFSPLRRNIEYVVLPIMHHQVMERMTCR